MDDFHLTSGRLSELFDLLDSELKKSGSLVVSVKSSSNTGKWGMAKLWRKWMGQTAKYMAENGVTMPLMISADGVVFSKRPFNAQDAHELFTSQHLGLNSKGERLSWAKSSSGNKIAASKGERFLAMIKHQNWCVDRGINLFNPNDGEFRKLEDEQNN